MKRNLRSWLLLVIVSAGAATPTDVIASSQVQRIITRSAVKSAAKTGEKKSIKILSKGVLRELPVGKESLKVICHADGSVTPALHNLGKNASKYSDEFNSLLLKERRSAITHNHQYIPVDRLSTTNATGNLTEASSRSKLRENLYKRMSKQYSDVAKGFGGTQAHHVVEGNSKAASKSREILKKFGIGINDAENGVLLPSDANSIFSGALHNTSHSEKYSEFVYSKIKNVKSREELIVRLTEVKKMLVNGNLDLAGNVASRQSKLVF